MDTVNTVCSYIVIAGLLVALFMMLYRIWVGPTPMDRLNALFLINTITIIFVVMVGMITHQLGNYIDIAILYGLTGFFSSVIMARFFLPPSYETKKEEE